MSFSEFCPISKLPKLLNELELNLIDDQSSTDVIPHCPIMVQARLHHSRRKGNILFLILREGSTLLQVICFKKKMPNPEDFQLLLKTPRESILRISGVFRKSPFLIATTGNHYEVEAQQVQVISSSLVDAPPLQVEDLNQSTVFDHSTDQARQGRPEVSVHQRLEHRCLDLRSKPNQAIFRIRAMMEHLIRRFLINRKFIEIHTPKLISIPSESGAQVFKIDNYFKKTAYLAQSPQLYKQMMINSDFRQVFEIGPVYRAEKSLGHRHLCEFQGFDLEMELAPWDDQSEVGYHQVFKLIGELFYYVQRELEHQCQSDLALLEKYYSHPSGKRPQFSHRIPVISFQEAVDWLNQAGCPQAPDSDLSHQAEQKLGELVKTKLGTDLFFLDRYPRSLRPFYTMCEPDNPTVTRSYDLILRGQEIASGAQRINDYTQLSNNLQSHGLTPKHYHHYLESFKYGSPPHAGIGIGLERLLALYLNIPDVHLTTLFPRDPTRLAP